MIYYDFSDFKHSVAPDADSARCRQVIVFLGNSLEFPNHNLEVMSAEVPGIDVLRVERLAEVAEIAGRERLKITLLMVAQDRLEDLTNRFARYADAAPGARIVYAYESEDFASEVYRTAIGQVVSYLPMRCRIDVWTAYMRLLCSGELIIPGVLAARKDNKVTDLHAIKQSVNLTPREKEVLSLVADGAGNREIAKQIGISEHTVKLHLHNVFAKLEVSNRAGAVAWYVRNVA